VGWVNGQTTWDGMQLAEVRQILTGQREAGCRIWVAGGWGVDALVGGQTRSHRDLDLAVDADDASDVVLALVRRGYHLETDWLPVRAEFAAAAKGWVDVHPVVFDDLGHGRQADLNGGHLDYPPAAFDVGCLGGMTLPCLSREQQLRFHSGYEPRAVDVHDLELLASLGPRAGG
jgi:lincosamide nucleotidyltransferase A/C/D/E